MKKTLYCVLLFVLVSCQEDPRKKALGFPIPSGLEKTEIVPTDSLHTKMLHVKKPVEPVYASGLIEEFMYIPLETTDDALIGRHINFILYKDHMYILDNIYSESVFIYKKNGEFVKKIGIKGGGPEEYYILDGMRIDKKMIIW